MFKIVQYSIVLLLLCVSCAKQQQSSTVNSQLSTFSADSAYTYIAQQLAFGARVPGTEAHENCGDWLVNELARHGAQVKSQHGTMTNYAGKPQTFRNIDAILEGASFVIGGQGKWPPGPPWRGLPEKRPP